jgi:hypothetical protein
MVKKLIAQLALMIMVGLLITPLIITDAIAAGAALGETPKPLSDFAAEPYSDLEACIQEQEQDLQFAGDPTKKLPGPDNGYIATIMEEPLNTEPVGKTNEMNNGNVVKEGDDYVVRRCYRNSFQFIQVKNVNGKSSLTPITVPMLATTCSKKAQELFNQYRVTDKNNPGYNETYQIKYSCKEVQVILTKGGTSAIYGYISMLYRWGASMVGIIAVTIIILSGIQISASGGDSEAINSAKKRILQSITGIVVLFLSSLILYTINPTFFTK